MENSELSLVEQSSNQLLHAHSSTIHIPKHEDITSTKPNIEPPNIPPLLLLI